MQEKISNHMQSLLHESTMAVGERGLERPPCITPDLPPMRQEEKDKELVMIHKKVDDIQRCIQKDATQVELSKKKAMSHSSKSSNCDVASRRRQAHRSLSSKKKLQPSNPPMHMHAKKDARYGKRKKRSKTPSSPSLLSFSLEESSPTPSPSEDEEDNFFPKRGKG